jgi:hypothetical protein
MVRNHEGLTKTYNRFHDPDEHSVDIQKLRELHANMDKAVLEAYGWRDLAQITKCDFLLDYDDDDDDAESPSNRRRKKPWRYRWPDDFRDKVLARLLELNEQRHKEEAIAGLATDVPRMSSDDEDEPSEDEVSKPAKATKSKQPRQSKKSKKPENPNQPKLEFDP